LTITHYHQKPFKTDKHHRYYHGPCTTIITILQDSRPLQKDTLKHKAKRVKHAIGKPFKTIKTPRTNLLVLNVGKMGEWDDYSS